MHHSGQCVSGPCWSIEESVTSASVHCLGVIKEESGFKVASGVAPKLKIVDLVAVTGASYLDRPLTNSIPSTHQRPHMFRYGYIFPAEGGFGWQG